MPYNLTVKCPCGLVCLDTWSLADGAIWEIVDCLGGGTSLKEAGPRRQASLVLCLSSASESARQLHCPPETTATSYSDHHAFSAMMDCLLKQ